jgi:hypothetical protein
MNNPEKVRDFLQKNPNQWFCDDCVGRGSDVDRHEVNTVCWTLALFPGEFRRISTIYSQHCNNRDKVATQAVNNSN